MVENHSYQKSSGPVFNPGNPISPAQYQRMFDDSMTRFAGRMNRRDADGRYGAWSYDPSTHILADGSDLHYVQRVGNFVREQDGRTVRCDRVDYRALAERVRDGSFYGWSIRCVYLPLADGSEVVCFGLGGGAQ